MGTSFVRSDFWDHLGGHALVMIGRWYSRQPSTNNKQDATERTLRRRGCGTN